MSVQVGIKTQWLVEYVKLMTEKNNSMNLKSKFKPVVNFTIVTIVLYKT